MQSRCPTLALGSVEQLTGWSVDPATGVITLATAPAAGVAVRAGFEFDVPLRFDERNYAFRSGMQSHVTAASPEIVDDMFGARLGVNQRWQTKRGPIGDQRIVDWVVLT